MYIEIDEELINLDKITKIKKIKSAKDEFSIVFEESSKPVKIIKYSSKEAQDSFFSILKGKLIKAKPIVDYKVNIEDSIKRTLSVFKRFR